MTTRGDRPVPDAQQSVSNGIAPCGPPSSLWGSLLWVSLPLRPSSIGGWNYHLSARVSSRSVPKRCSGECPTCPGWHLVVRIRSVAASSRRLPSGNCHPIAEASCVWPECCTRNSSGLRSTHHAPQWRTRRGAHHGSRSVRSGQTSRFGKRRDHRSPTDASWSRARTRAVRATIWACSTEPSEMSFVSTSGRLLTVLL